MLPFLKNSFNSKQKANQKMKNAFSLSKRPHPPPSFPDVGLVFLFHAALWSFIHSCFKYIVVEEPEINEPWSAQNCTYYCVLLLFAFFPSAMSWRSFPCSYISNCPFLKCFMIFFLFFLTVIICCLRTWDIKIWVKHSPPPPPLKSAQFFEKVGRVVKN